MGSKGFIIAERNEVPVLDLGLGERGLLDHRPEHRPGAPVKPAVDDELADLGDDLRLGVAWPGGFFWPGKKGEPCVWFYFSSE